ncbi:MAG: hypothetical protein OMM_01246 [Candidatus Magnetoglobus multicellularis str. Araruama]|uniref:Uncharacterized protein n=1 Tax=Candidatus Magnetoglobus multicellularis str. Araruama TaxID=890399 RepID=A0A1V1PDS0_9BACT|nr:MAG: hypothetical protein OMM_01246 [Candidatus Magnetoglobus multicellularis str. Araruama]
MKIIPSLLCIYILFLPVCLTAKTIHVPSDYATISDAVTDAMDGDTIMLADGTHMCTQTIQFKGINLKANEHGGGCTIVFQGDGQFRFEDLDSDKVQTNAEFMHLTFKGATNQAIYCHKASPEFTSCTFTNNGNDNIDGGAVYCKEARPFFNQCIFQHNQAKNGGALYLDENANATFNECHVYSNTAKLDGGGIYIIKASPAFFISDIDSNSANEGGGVYINESNPSFGRCIIKNNTASSNGGGGVIYKSTQIAADHCFVYNNNCLNGNGGGLCLIQTQSLSLENFIIYDNHSKKGGGLYLDNDTNPVIQKCKIYRNTAAEEGGAIYLNNATAPNLINLLVAENTAIDAGGAYFESCLSAEIIFCTFGRNKSTNTLSTGIVYFYESKASIVNSILWNPTINALENEEIKALNCENPIVEFSDIEIEPYTNNHHPYNNESNINRNPLFENVSNPDNNRYFHLEDLNEKRQTSPCINTGKQDDNLPEEDCNGIKRKGQGDSYDMGAFEYIAGGADLSANPEYGRDPLIVNLICKANPSNDYKSYTFTMNFGDGSNIQENSHGDFTHEYRGGLFHPKCTIILKQQPTIYSTPDPITINVASFEWRFDTGGVIESSPAIGHDGTIFVGSDTGAMFAIHPDGTQKWQFQTGGRTTSSPAVYSNNVIFGSEDHHVYNVNVESGLEKWRFPTHGPVYSSPAIDKSGNIYIGSCDHNLYAITPDGRRKWSFFTNGHIISSPSIVYFTNRYGVLLSTVYVGSHDNHMYALDMETGQLQWSINVGGDVLGTPAISNDRTIFVAGCITLGEVQLHNLYALNPDGTIKWKFEMRRGAYASPVLFSDTIKSKTVGMVILGSYDNSLYGLSYSGEEEWAFPTRSDSRVRAGDILSTAAVGSSGTIYFGSENHSIYAIDHEKGRVRWSYKTDGPIYSSPVIDNNVLYVGSFDHCLYAIRANDQLLSDSSPWPVFHQNTAHHSCMTIDEKTMPPTILHTYPSHNETDVAANVPITLTVTFSKIMDESSIDIAFESAMDVQTLPGNKITYSYPFINEQPVTVASFQPISPTLEFDTRYKVKISSTAIDQYGEKLQGDWTWIFYSEPEDKGSGDPSGMRGCFIGTMRKND